MQICRMCGDHMPKELHKSYQTMCWSCFNKENRSSRALVGGHVYIAEYWNMHTDEPVENIYKVGMTERENPQKRIAELGDTLGVVKCRIVRHWACEDPRTAENILHNKLKDKRIEGEWFAHDKLTLIKLIDETL